LQKFSQRSNNKAVQTQIAVSR